MTASSLNILAVIPARYGSSRLPGKPLIDLDGRPMIQHVYERVSRVFDQVIVATDDERICHVVDSFQGQAIMTSIDHLNGTSRVSEVASIQKDLDYVINVQGDEPMIDLKSMSALLQLLENSRPDIGTVVSPVMDPEGLNKLHEVFVVTDKEDRALYFSRSVIPARRDRKRDQWFEPGLYKKHLGLYAYKPHVLADLVNLPPSRLEMEESLEQNRWLENGYRIHTVECSDCSSLSVDTAEDAELVRLNMRLMKS